LARQGVLKRVYLDEMQQLIVEYGFRSSYQCRGDLGRIGVPMMCLLGSMPGDIAMSLMSYCGLSGIQTLDFVDPTDPIGDGFSFDVAVVRDVTKEIVNFVLSSRVGACHVLCSSTTLVATITEELSKTLKVLSITGDSTWQDQVRCAKSWSKGDHDVLVSTVVALVGNENKFCKTIVVGGFLFNVSSLVQAIGRLCPSQSGQDSIVKVFHTKFFSADCVTASETGGNLFREALEAGCVNDSDRDMFMAVYAPVGLQEVLLMRDGCYLQKHSSVFGFALATCTRCGLCLQPVELPFAVT